MKALLGSTLGKATLVGLVIVILGVIARQVYDQATIPEEKRRSTEVEGLLSDSVGALKDYVEKHGALPPSAGWTPAEIACGEPVPVPPEAAAHETWVALGVRFEASTTFQYRFRARGDDFELLARADNDCDGVHQVHKLTGGKNWSGLGARIQVDNPGE